MKTCKIAATRGNLATGSFSFVGTGAADVNPRQHNDRIVYGYTLD